MVRITNRTHPPIQLAVDRGIESDDAAIGVSKDDDVPVATEKVSDDVVRAAAILAARLIQRYQRRHAVHGGEYIVGCTPVSVRPGVLRSHRQN